MKEFFVGLFMLIIAIVFAALMYQQGYHDGVQSHEKLRVSCMFTNGKKITLHGVEGILSQSEHFSTFDHGGEMRFPRDVVCSAAV